MQTLNVISESPQRLPALVNKPKSEYKGKNFIVGNKTIFYDKGWIGYSSRF